MRLRNDQRHRTDNTGPSAENGRGGHVVGSGNPDLNPERLDRAQFLERRRRSRLSNLTLEAYRAAGSRAATERALSGRIDALVNRAHAHDRAFIAHERSTYRNESQPMATVDLTEEVDEPPIAPLPIVSVENIRFAGLSPFRFSTTSESSLSSDSDTTSLNSDEELVLEPGTPYFTPTSSPTRALSSSGSGELMDSTSSPTSSASNNEE